MTLYEAVDNRKSIRKYNMKPISEDKLEMITRFAESLPILFPDIKVEFKILNCIKEENKNNYFNKIQPFMVKAPYYLIISSTKDTGCYLNAGYLMEQVALYLTTKNIGTCFLGATRLSDKVNINPEMEHIITLAFGKSKSKGRPRLKKTKRLEEGEIVKYKEDVSEGVKKIINAGRLAPSSMNNQPWRFIAYRNRIHVFYKKNVVKNTSLSSLKQIDIGAAVSNMLVAIDEMWLYAEIFRSESISKKVFKNYEYVITITLNSSLQDLE